jgi:hypothetical protein
VRRAVPLAALATLAIAGCGGGGEEPPGRDDPPLARTAPSLGPGPRYRPPSLGSRAAKALPIGRMRCWSARQPRYGVHLELFAARRVVLVAPGIGVAPPRTRDGAYVRGGRCSYPLSTREPSGVIEVAGAGGQALTLGDLFDVWGQPLSPTRMAGFRGRVRAYVGGRRWRADPRAIPLRRHAQIVLQVGGYVRPHRTYGFPRGL